MRFLKDSLINLAGQWLVILLTLLVHIVVARLAGPEGKGLYTLLVMTGSLITLIINLGLSRAAIYYIGNGSYSIQQILNHVWSLTLLIGGTAALLTFIALTFMKQPVIDEIPNVYLLAIALNVPFLLSNLAISNIFIALERFMWANLVPALNALLNLLLVATLMFLDIGNWALVLAIVIASITSSLVGWITIRKLIGPLRFELKVPIVKALLSYGIRAYSFAITSFLNLRLDQFIIGLMLNISQLGIYSAAVAISELSSKISRAITTVLFTRVSASTSDEANQLTGRVSRLSLAITFLFCVATALGGEYIIRIAFTDEFAMAYLPLLLLLPGILCFNLSQILSTDLAGRGKPEIGTYATLIGLIVTVIGNFILTPIYGIAGAAITASMAYFVAAVVVAWVYMQVSKQTLLDIIFLSRNDFLAVKQLFI